MKTLFTCNPQCILDIPGFNDWTIVIAVFICVFAITTLFKKWAFEWNSYQEGSIKWHVPRFLFVLSAVSLVTYPAVYALFGSAGAYVYGKLILPELSVFVYIGWLLASET